MLAVELGRSADSRRPLGAGVAVRWSMSATERRALLLLLSLGLSGQGVRWWATRPGESPGAHRDSIAAATRPLGPGERIDADRATAAELARLPRVGLALAKTIVADRETHGAFGGPEGLDRVPGIGPGLLAAVGPHLSFSGAARAPTSGQTARSAAFASQRVNLNSASVSELDGLPGIGPARAAAILRERETRGPFTSVDDLSRVPGLGPSAIARLRDQVDAR
jgi:competence protein ComEA